MTQQPMAYLNNEFLDSAEARPIRILSEYLEPLRRFREQKIQDTIVFFGSARVDSRERAERALATLRARGVRVAERSAGKRPLSVHLDAAQEDEAPHARADRSARERHGTRHVDLPEFCEWIARCIVHHVNAGGGVDDDIDTGEHVSPAVVR